MRSYCCISSVISNYSHHLLTFSRRMYSLPGQAPVTYSLSRAKNSLSLFSKLLWIFFNDSWPVIAFSRAILPTLPAGHITWQESMCSWRLPVHTRHCKGLWDYWRIIMWKWHEKQVQITLQCFSLDCNQKEMVNWIRLLLQMSSLFGYGTVGYFLTSSDIS